MTCGTDSDEWLDPSSPEAEPYIRAVIEIDPVLATGEKTCRHSQYVTGCCVVNAHKIGVCCAIAHGVTVCSIVSGENYYEWLWSF